jgi:multiple sugar transport system ATP-binding protein
VPYISIKNVSKVFPGGKLALDGITLALENGEFLALLGPSGSGKSTLLRILAGLTLPTSGFVSIGDRDAEGLSPRQRDAAIIFQNQSLFPHLNVRDNLAFSAEASGVNRTEARRLASEAATLLGLGDRLNSMPSQLSGGQKQRVALGRVMVRKPSLFLLDEPFSNLDPPLRASLVEDVRSLHKRIGSTTILVTHEPREALALADRIAFLHEGRLVQVDVPRVMQEQPGSREIAEFFGAIALRA